MDSQNSIIFDSQEVRNCACIQYFEQNLSKQYDLTTKTEVILFIYLKYYVSFRI